MAAAHGVFAPDRVVLPIDPSNEASKAWFREFNPEALAMIEGATKEVQATGCHTCDLNNLVALQGTAVEVSLTKTTAAFSLTSFAVVFHHFVLHTKKNRLLTPDAHYVSLEAALTATSEVRMSPRPCYNCISETNHSKLLA